MPSNNNKKKNTPRATAKPTGFSVGELDSRKACKLLPPERQSQFVKDYCQAVDLFEEAKESLVHSPYVGGLCMTYEDDDGAVDCRHNLHACACLLQALPLLTDMRLPVETGVMQLLPGSRMSCHVTLDAHQVGHPNLHYMGMRRFLVILVDAIQMKFAGMLQEARLLVHELEAQLDGDYIDFEELDFDPELYCGLTKQDVEFAVAVIGVKVNRSLYRLPPEQRVQRSFPVRAPDNGTLLADCRRFAERQNLLRPESPVGSMNMGWYEVEVRNLQEAHRWYKESVKRADAQENDIVKCTSRLEYAGSIVRGKGVYSPVMRINRQEVQDLYSAYRNGCVALSDWHMAAFAQGEPAMLDLVLWYLREHPHTDRNGMTPAIDPSKVFNGFRDVGRALKAHKCDGCGKQFMKVQTCSGCKKKSYCGKECQTAHWMNGHKKECKRLRDAKA